MTSYFMSNVDGATLAFEHEGKGPAVLLMSGLGGSAAFWKGVSATLTAQGYQVIRMDQRGIGQSERGAAAVSIAQLADDFHQLLQHCGVERAHVVGHSTGGCIAQQLAFDQPEKVRSLVLGATWAGPNAYMQQLFTLRAQLLRLDPQCYEQQGVYLSYPAEWIWEHDALVATGKKWESQHIQTVQERIAALLQFDGRDQAAALSVPSLILSAEDDAVVPHALQQELKTLLAGSVLTQWVRGGHFFPITLSHSYNDTLLSWFSRFTHDK